METTPKYGLQKPGVNDFADISVLNANSDKVDAALDGLERGKETPQGAQAKAAAAKSEAVSAAATDATAKADAAREAAKAASVPLAQKGVAGGVATLTSAGVLPLAQVPDEAKEQRVVANIAARDAIGKKFVGLSVYVKDATADPTVKRGGAYYLWDGAWNKTAEAESMDMSLTWDNVEGKPAVFPPASHRHSASDITGVINTGDIKFSAVSNAPLGWLPCDGRKIDSAQYPELCAAVGRVDMADAVFDKLLIEDSTLTIADFKLCGEYYVGCGWSMVSGTEYGTIIYSKDLVSWGKKTINPNIRFNGIAYGNGYFVLSTQSTHIFYSSSLTGTFSSKNMGFSGLGVRFFNGKFFQLKPTEYGLYLQYSDNLVDWVTSNRISTSLINKGGTLYFLNGEYVVTATSGKTIYEILHSKSFTGPWVSKIFNLESYIRWFSYVNGEYFLICHDGFTNTLHHSFFKSNSIDGTWSETKIDTGGANYINCTFENGMFMLFGEKGSPSTIFVLYGTNFTGPFTERTICNGLIDPFFALNEKIAFLARMNGSGQYIYSTGLGYSIPSIPNLSSSGRISHSYIKT